MVAGGAASAGGAGEYREARPASHPGTHLDALAEQDHRTAHHKQADAETVLPCFTAASRLDMERKLVPTHYDAFRLDVSSSYREIFARDLAKVLARKHWRVVRSRSKAAKRLAGESDAQLELLLN